MSKHWMQKWGDHGWAFDDPNGREATLGVYQRKGEWRSVVQARAGLDTEDIAARVIAKLANRVAELEAAVLRRDTELERWKVSTMLETASGDPEGLTPEMLERFMDSEGKRSREMEEAIRWLHKRLFIDEANADTWIHAHPIVRSLVEREEEW